MLYSYDFLASYKIGVLWKGAFYFDFLRLQNAHAHNHPTSIGTNYISLWYKKLKLLRCIAMNYIDAFFRAERIESIFFSKHRDLPADL